MARTLSMTRLTQEERLVAALLYPERGHWRPQTRGDCADGPRPCPFVGCRHHLYLEVNRSGNIKLNTPAIEVWDLAESCSLDVAERDDEPRLEDVGELFGGITRQAVQLTEARGLKKLRIE